MADFYKGYFEDRYSFAHSDKKWYEKHKDAVSKYNHEYYERHKKKLANDLVNGVKDASNMPVDELLEYQKTMKAGDMYLDNGEYWIKKNSSPQDKLNDWARTKSLKEAIELSTMYTNSHVSNVGKAAGEMERVFDLSSTKNWDNTVAKGVKGFEASVNAQLDKRANKRRKSNQDRYKTKSSWLSWE